MSVKDFMSEEHHPTMFVSSDGKIGQINGVSFIRTHVYAKTPPKFIPSRLWYWIVDLVTYTVSESDSV
jgi:hypothetical protein